MGHLTTESLARIVDEVPTDTESQHLKECRICSEELDALRAQTEALGALPALRPPRGDWEVLEARLIAEGLIESRRVREVIPIRAPRLGGWVTQVAAALVLFVGGSVVGATLNNSPTPADLAVQGGGMPALAAGNPATNPGTGFTTVDEAAADVRRAEENYIDALVRYRQLLEGSGSGTPSTYDPTSRFAALEAITAASQAAVREAPTDPFLNGILASVMAERQSYVQTMAQSNDDNWY